MCHVATTQRAYPVRHDETIGPSEKPVYNIWIDGPLGRTQLAEGNPILTVWSCRSTWDGPSDVFWCRSSVGTIILLYLSLFHGEDGRRWSHLQIVMGPIRDSGRGCGSHFVYLELLFPTFLLVQGENKILIHF